MKRILTFILIGFIQLNGISQTNLNKIEVEVEKQVEVLRKGMIDADVSKLKEVTSTYLSYGHSGGHVENQAEFIEKIVSGKSDFVTIELKEQTISIVDDVAIVRHKLYAHTNDSNVEKDIQLGILLVWQKHKNNWLLIARQAFKLPTNNKH